MSPTKAASVLRRTTRGTATAPPVSPVRRRLRSAAPSRLPDSRSKKPVIARSIFKDTTAPSSSQSNIPLSHANDSNKENLNILRTSNSRVLRSSRARSPISGLAKKGKKFLLNYEKPATRSRVPLRELTCEEVFERDEATLGDLRRRRSGEHSGTYIEFDSHHAVLSQPPAARNATPLVDAPPEDTDSIVFSAAPSEKIDVLRRTPSQELLISKVEALVAASSTGIGRRKSARLSAGLATARKWEHPAASTSTSSTVSSANSPALPRSPVLAPRNASPIAKCSPSPVRVTRMGLGVKTCNTLLKEASKGATEVKKRVAASNSIVSAKKSVGKRTGGVSSLRRAAGATAKPVTSARAGLDNIRRMR